MWTVNLELKQLREPYSKMPDIGAGIQSDPNRDKEFDAA